MYLKLSIFFPIQNCPVAEKILNFTQQNIKNRLKIFFFNFIRFAICLTDMCVMLYCWGWRCVVDWLDTDVPVCCYVFFLFREKWQMIIMWNKLWAIVRATRMRMFWLDQQQWTSIDCATCSIIICSAIEKAFLGCRAQNNNNRKKRRKRKEKDFYWTWQLKSYPSHFIISLNKEEDEQRFVNKGWKAFFFFGTILVHDNAFGNIKATNGH